MLIKVGQITAPHGIRGALVVRSFMEVPEDLFALPLLHDEAHREIVFQSFRLLRLPNIFRVSLEAITSRDQASGLRGTWLYTQRECLPKLESEDLGSELLRETEGSGLDTFYYADLVGMHVCTTQGLSVGQVVRVANFGAGDVVEILLHGGRTEFLLFHKNFVKSVCCAKKEMCVWHDVCVSALALGENGENGKDQKPKREGTKQKRKEKEKEKRDDVLGSC